MLILKLIATVSFFAFVIMGLMVSFDREFQIESCSNKDAHGYIDFCSTCGYQRRKQG